MLVRYMSGILVARMVEMPVAMLVEILGKERWLVVLLVQWFVGGGGHTGNSGANVGGDIGKGGMGGGAVGTTVGIGGD